VQWRVVIPIKPAEVAKTRLRGATGAEATHARLVLALQRDTVAAVLAAASLDPTVAGVYVLSAEPPEWLAAGVSVLRDLGGGLNAALDTAAADVRARHPGEGVAALVADLPALRAAEFVEVLRAARSHRRSFVPDASGRGTTMLIAGRGQPLDPAFGPDSAIRHRSSGAVELAAGLGARTDVDTAEDLQRCLELGVGSHTAQMVAHLV